MNHILEGNGFLSKLCYLVNNIIVYWSITYFNYPSNYHIKQKILLGYYYYTFFDCRASCFEQNFNWKSVSERKRKTSINSQ